MKVNLRTKLLAAFGTILALLAIVGFIGWRSTTFLSSELQSQYDDNVQGAVLLARAQGALWELRYGLSQFILADSQARAQILANQDKWYQIIEESISTYKAGNRTPAELEALAVWEDIYPQYKGARPRWFELQGAGLTEEAAEWRAQTTFPFGAASVQALDTLVTLQQQVAEDKQHSAVAQANASIQWLIGVTVLALAVGLAIGFSLARSIAGAANLVARASGAIAQGDVAQEVRIDSGDELEQMALSFGQMVDYLREMTQAADRLAEGDLTVQIEPRSDKDALGHAFLRMTDNLRDLIGEVQQGAVQLTYASEQINDNVEQTGRASQQVAQIMQQVARGTAQQTQAVTDATSNIGQVTRAAEGIARGAQEQALSVQRTAALVGEMSDVVSQVGEVAQTVSEASTRVALSARQGAVAAGQNRSGMEQIQARTGQAMTRVKEMGSRTTEIVRIVEVIDDIADKTDMLALNAAVEAARGRAWARLRRRGGPGTQTFRGRQECNTRHRKSHRARQRGRARGHRGDGGQCHRGQQWHAPGR